MTDSPAKSASTPTPAAPSAVMGWCKAARTATTGTTRMRTTARRHASPIVAATVSFVATWLQRMRDMKPVTTATTTSSMVATRSATAAVMDNLAVMRVAMTEMMSLEMAARSVGGRHAAMVNSTRVSNAMTVIKAMTTLARTHASPCVNTLIFKMERTPAQISPRRHTGEPLRCGSKI